jgi:hypothetical protein
VLPGGICQHGLCLMRRVALAGKVSLSNLGGTSRPRRSSWGENLRYTSRFPNVSQIFQKSDFLKKNLPKSRPKNGSDAEISINLAQCRGPYLARANSRAQCQGPHLRKVLRTGTMPRYGSRAWSLCAQLEGCASRYERLRASVSTVLRSTTKVVRRDTFYSGQCNVRQT